MNCFGRRCVCRPFLYTCVHTQCNVFRFGCCFEARKNWIYATRCGNLSFMYSWYLLHKKYRGWCFADSMNEGSWINDRGATTLINHLQIYSLHQYVSCVPPKSNYFFRTSDGKQMCHILTKIPVLGSLVDACSQTCML